MGDNLARGPRHVDVHTPPPKVCHTECEARSGGGGSPLAANTPESTSPPPPPAGKGAGRGGPVPPPLLLRVPHRGAPLKSRVGGHHQRMWMRGPRTTASGVTVRHLALRDPHPHCGWAARGAWRMPYRNRHRVGRARTPWRAPRARRGRVPDAA